jgi:sulfite reductase (ferredoxin)
MAEVEEIKAASHYLRGTLADELANSEPRFTEDASILLKFHGIYQQDDRDVRRERAQQKLPLEYICMVRAAIPGGILTAEQYLAMDEICDEVADGSLRITTRQGIQFHFTHKDGLRPLIKILNDKLVTTLAACGDVVRNTMCCPAPRTSPIYAQTQTLANEIANKFRPKTNAYYEVWLDGERAASAYDAGESEQVEPLYGEHYLPRKFKIAIAYPGDNCVDAYTQDVAAVARQDGDNIVGYTILVGGGFGVSHADDTTYPRLGTLLTTVKPEEVIDVIEAIIIVQRDNGERGDRKHARLKYLIDRWGEAKFKAAVEEQLGRPLPDAIDPVWHAAHDHLGWSEQGDGRWFLGLRIESGRIRDTEELKLRTALRELISRYQLEVRFTPNQDVLLCNIESKDRRQIEAILRKANVTFAGELAPIVRTAMACPALPTCGLALTEAERVLPQVMDQLQQVMADNGLANDDLIFRMTGCPNGCARPYSAEIGLVGRGKTSYDIMLGGNHLGTRLATTYVKNIKRDKLGETIRPVFELYAQERAPEESFGDWCARVGVENLPLPA